jgi:hypothetical protein
MTTVTGRPPRLHVTVVIAGAAERGGHLAFGWFGTKGGGVGMTIAAVLPGLNTSARLPLASHLPGSGWVQVAGESFS